MKGYNMLSVVFRNLNDGSPVSDYSWHVIDNGEVIASGRLSNFKREDGWQTLIWQFARSLESDGENYTKEST